MGVCMYGYMYAFRRVWGIELKFGMGVGEGLPSFVSIFSKQLHQRSRVIQWSSCFRNALWLPGSKNPWSECNAFLGLRLCRCQIAQEYTLCGNPILKNPCLKCSALMEFKVMNPWPESKTLMGSKFKIGVSLGQPQVRFA